MARLRGRRWFEHLLSSRKGVGAALALAGFAVFVSSVPGWFLAMILAVGLLYLGARLYAQG